MQHCRSEVTDNLLPSSPRNHSCSQVFPVIKVASLHNMVNQIGCHSVIELDQELGYRETLIAHCLLFRKPSYLLRFRLFLVCQTFRMGELANGIRPHRVDVDCQLGHHRPRARCCTVLPWRKLSLYLARLFLIGALVRHRTPQFPRKRTSDPGRPPSAYHWFWYCFENLLQSISASSENSIEPLFIRSDRWSIVENVEVHRSIACRSFRGKLCQTIGLQIDFQEKG